MSRQRPAELRAVSRPKLSQCCCALGEKEGRPSPQAVDRDERPWPRCQTVASRSFRPQPLRPPCCSRPARNPCTPASALTRRTWGLHFCGQSNRCKRCARNAGSGACDGGQGSDGCVSHRGGCSSSRGGWEEAAGEDSVCRGIAPAVRSTEDGGTELTVGSKLVR